LQGGAISVFLTLVLTLLYTVKNVHVLLYVHICFTSINNSFFCVFVFLFLNYIQTNLHKRLNAGDKKKNGGGGGGADEVGVGVGCLVQTKG